MNPVRLTPQQRFRLRRQLRTTDDLGFYRRTLGLLELDWGSAVTEVAIRLGVSRRMVHGWIATYRHHPVLCSLVTHHSTGRPPEGDEDARAILRGVLGPTTGSLRLPGHGVDHTVAPISSGSLGFDRILRCHCVRPVACLRSCSVRETSYGSISSTPSGSDSRSQSRIWSRRRWMAPSHTPRRRCLSRTPSSSALAFKKSRKLRSDSRPFASGDFREGEVSSFGMTAPPTPARLYPDLIIPSRLRACRISLASVGPGRHGVDSGRVSDTIRPRSSLTRLRGTPGEHKPCLP